MAELRGLDLVTYDNSSGNYCWKENKAVFHNKAEYELALSHSKKLVFSTSQKQRADQVNPPLFIDKLAFEAYRDIDDKCVLQHLETGYPDVYRLLMKYKELMEKTGLSKSPHLPKLPDRIDFLASTETPMEMVTFAATIGSNVKVDVNSKSVKQLINLRDLLIGKIYFIVEQVRHGTPLYGYCECCPHRFIEIEK